MSTKDSVKSLVSLLNRCGGILAEAYSRPNFDLPADADPTLVGALLDRRIVWNPDIDNNPHAMPRLRPPTRSWLDDSTRSERLRDIDEDVGGKITSIEEQLARYQAASRSGTTADADIALEELQEMVFTVVDSLVESTRRLSVRVSNEFSYAQSLTAKVAENERAITQAEKLINSIAHLDLNRLSELSGSSTSMRKLFSGYLYDNIQRCNQDLHNILLGMRETLFSFRQMERRTEMILGFANHFEKYPGHDFSPVLDSMPIPEKLVHAAPIKFTHTIDFKDSILEDRLAEMLVGLRKDHVPAEIAADVDPIEATSLEQEPEAIELNMLEKSAEKLILRAGREKTTLYASENLDMAPDETTLEEWCTIIDSLFHRKSNAGFTKVFDIDWVGKELYPFTGNYLAHDVRIKYVGKGSPKHVDNAA
jgi:hypothetical protein